MSHTKLYKKFIRPSVADLMSLLQIDKEYVNGEGDYLTTSEGTEVLDVVGGYGANLLGHNNSEVVDLLKNSLGSISPSNVQGSVRSHSSELGELFSNLLSKETGRPHYVCHLSNSGTESVEAALKLAALRSYERRVKYRQRNQQALNVLSSMEPNKIRKVNKELMDKLNLTEVRDLINFINKHNRTTFKSPFTYLAIEGSFHGKTLGSLNVTYQDTYKEKFLQSNNCLFVKRNNISDLSAKIESANRTYYHYEETTGKITLKPLSYIIGIIAEPIQGEAGIHELSKEFLVALRQAADECSSLLIFDEIQSGLYRTGKLSASSHHGVVADVYTFSKSLGGGVAKIAATVIDSDYYYPQFGILHTSTFAEDETSSAVAKLVLNKLSNSVDKSFEENAKYFKNKLQELAKKHNEIVISQRGHSFMQAFEISGDFLQRVYEFKLYDDIGLFGHLFSSAVLNHENIRIAPTLSSPRSLRLEPSIYFGKKESDRMFEGLDNALTALKNLDMGYFYSHLSEGIEIAGATKVEASFERKNEECAVFLNHLIHTKDAHKLTSAFKNFPEEALEELMYSILEYANFTVYDIKEIESPSGKKIDAILFSLPVSTKVIYQFMKEGRAHIIISKIQQAIVDAKQMGATTVGLGQFTSIISNNGLTLDPYGLNLTTGNAYTVGLGIQGALRVCKEKLGKDENLNLGCVGAAGNIVSVATSLLADNASKITLIYHTPFKDSPKMQKAFYSIVKEIIKSHSDCELVKKVKSIAKNDHDFTALYLDGKFKDVIEVSTDLSDLKECDLIFSGTNSQGILLKQEHIKENTVIVDVGVPSNVDPNIKLNNVVVIHGGLAKLPSETEFKNPAFPLPKGESFACMAETFALSLNDEYNMHHIGNLNKEIVQRAIRIATESGITLGNIKSMNLF